MKILLVTPPLTQLNTPYPATAYIKGFLNQLEIVEDVKQIDLGIQLINRIFSKKFLKVIFKEAREKKLNSSSKRMLALENEYIAAIEEVILFLKGKNPSLAYQIVNFNFLPQGNSFNDTAIEQIELFGENSIYDKAKFIATLFLNDIGTFIQENIIPHFGFSRYAESLARVATSFEPILTAVNNSNNCIDKLMKEILLETVSDYKPDLVAFSVPFPGNVYAAFLGAKHIKSKFRNVKTVLGGGYPNTELRSLKEVKVFDFFDYVCLDDGERPLECVIEHILEKRNSTELKRTFIRENEKVIYKNGAKEADYGHLQSFTPDFEGLNPDEYISFFEINNPMHRLWNDTWWNKLTLAHGCYWKKCSFCDVSLDYIGRYEPNTASAIVDQIEKIISQTGKTGFHFVDEAAPPLLLRDLAIELLRRKSRITWWTNIRFEKTFTFDLCKLLAASGCIAVTGGLEVASDRLLTLMEKGVTIAQVAQVTNHFASNGILVHAYLMYGFPTQTEQETIDSLEIVRQLFENNLIQSAYWHRFALTWHSPVGLNPAKYNIEITGPKEGDFANNDLYFVDKQGAMHEKFTDGLNKALYNYMHSNCIDWSVNKWFQFTTPKTTHPKNLIYKHINKNFTEEPNNYKVLWLGPEPVFNQSKSITIHTLFEKKTIEVIETEIEFVKLLHVTCSLKNKQWPSLSEVMILFENTTKTKLIKPMLWELLRENVLLVLKV